MRDREITDDLRVSITRDARELEKFGSYRVRVQCVLSHTSLRNLFAVLFHSTLPALHLHLHWHRDHCSSTEEGLIESPKIPRQSGPLKTPMECLLAIFLPDTRRPEYINPQVFHVHGPERPDLCMSPLLVAATCTGHRDPKNSLCPV